MAEHQQLKPLSYTDRQAVKVLTAHRLDIFMSSVDVAEQQLEGKPVHLFGLSYLDRDAKQAHNHLVVTSEMAETANSKAREVAKEYGFAW